MLLGLLPCCLPLLPAEPSGALSLSSSAPELKPGSPAKRVTLTTGTLSFLKPAAMPSPRARLCRNPASAPPQVEPESPPTVVCVPCGSLAVCSQSHVDLEVSPERPCSPHLACWKARHGPGGREADVGSVLLQLPLRGEQAPSGSPRREAELDKLS